MNDLMHLARPRRNGTDLPDIARQPSTVERVNAARQDVQARKARRIDEAIKAARALPRQPRNAGRLVVR